MHGSDSSWPTGCRGKREYHGKGSAKNGHEDNREATVDPGSGALEPQNDVDEVACPEGCRHPGEVFDPVRDGANSRH